MQWGRPTCEILLNDTEYTCTTGVIIVINTVSTVFIGHIFIDKMQLYMYKCTSISIIITIMSVIKHLFPIYITRYARKLRYEACDMSISIRLIRQVLMCLFSS